MHARIGSHWPAMFASGYVNTASTTFVVYFIKEIYNACTVFTYSSLMQTLEGVWENSKALCKPKPHTKLLSSPKLPLVFATGYVNLVHILYFLTLHVKYYYSLAIPFIQLHWPIENKYICMYTSGLLQKYFIRYFMRPLVL